DAAGVSEVREVGGVEGVCGEDAAAGVDETCEAGGTAVADGVAGACGEDAVDEMYEAEEPIS
ncbi:MAG TPA: hypothetical protein DEW10_01960, partial [Bifidobacterium sp.]|nr:hypothetical protein [Bifidobacterium sp.]